MVRNWLLVQGSKLKKLGSEKVLTITMTKLNELLMHNLTELVGHEEAMKKIFEGGMSLGNEFMIELSAHLINDINTMPAYAETAWILFAGKQPTSLSFEKKIIKDTEVWILEWADADCPFCRNIQFPHKFCSFPAGAFQGASQTWSALTNDGEFHTLAREVKCKAQGADECKWILVTVKRDVPLEFIKDNMPELFEDIQFGFVDY